MVWPLVVVLVDVGFGEQILLPNNNHVVVVFVSFRKAERLNPVLHLMCHSSSFFLFWGGGIRKDRPRGEVVSLFQSPT